MQNNFDHSYLIYSIVLISHFWLQSLKVNGCLCINPEFISRVLRNLKEKWNKLDQETTNKIVDIAVKNGIMVYDPQRECVYGNKRPKK